MEIIGLRACKVVETLEHSHFPSHDQKKRPLKVNGRRRLSPFILLLVPYLAEPGRSSEVRVSLWVYGFFGSWPNGKVKLMYLLSSSVFCKQITCPRSELLTTYCTTGAITGIESLIEEHLAACDFCGAEAQLLTKYPPTEENFAPPAIPESLRSLAEAILCRHTSTSQNPIFEKEGLTLTDA